MANAVENKSLDFAVRMVNLYKYLTEEHKEYVLSKQILRSGTGIGANIAEAQGCQSDADFIAKMHISLKECSETCYWLNLLEKTNYLSDAQAESLNTDANELKALLVSIIKATKARISKA